MTEPYYDFSGTGIEMEVIEEGVWPFPCCEHCGCDDERTGHDDSCRFGCNDASSEDTR